MAPDNEDPAVSGGTDRENGHDRKSLVVFAVGIAAVMAVAILTANLVLNLV